MPHCDECNGFVSERFKRVFADEQGRVWACHSCETRVGVAETIRDRIVSLNGVSKGGESV